MNFVPREFLKSQLGSKRLYKLPSTIKQMVNNYSQRPTILPSS